MTETGSYGMLGFQLDVKQILLEAQHRWLRPAEICEILRNYQKFHISPEAPNNPLSGSVFLFDRKVLRYFRKDGHNWRKKKDGKTVKEAHEKLKVGSVDMLHCYYAHGEDNDNFQRRSYWLLEQDLMNIVFVHYLEVKGSKTNISSVRNTDTILSNSENDRTLSSNFCGASHTSNLSSAYEDAESEDIHQASSRFHSYPESPLTDEGHSSMSSSCKLPCPGNQNTSSLLNYASNGDSVPQSKLDFASVQEVFGNCSTGGNAYKQADCYLPLLSNMQEKSLLLNQEAEIINSINPTSENNTNTAGHENYSFLLKRPLINGLQTGESLKKVDSFSRWIAKELGESDELNLQSSNGLLWSIMGSEYDTNMQAQLVGDTDTLSPSISQDQLFSITEFSPNWAFSNLETKVLIAGKFLKSDQELSKCRWSVMFGEVEVPAEVLSDGILCSYAPLHKPGIVPFYITCSNRSACSEIREFEYKFRPNKKITAIDVNESTSIMMHLYHRFEMLLYLPPTVTPASSNDDDIEKQHIVNKIIYLMEEENNQETSLTSKNKKLELKGIAELLLEKKLKETFYYWLLREVTEEGKGPAFVDEGGQGILHLAAALGLNWALQPIIVSGVSIDFRDVNGWTALHWAAFCGREDTVVALVSLCASPGALTDPCAEHPLGRTPADLASSSGHKGISGFLAESSLTTHLSTLKVNEDHHHHHSIHTVSERLAVPPTTPEEVPETLSLKDSLAAVCNATSAAARIHQIFRIQSFQRKRFTEEGGGDELDERAVSLVAGKAASRLGCSSGGVANAAAVSIQKKFRGWKKRKEFLMIRQKIVRIQAHVRGHQVRKKHKPILWSVGILEKVILRWRRKGSGLRGFRSDGMSNSQDTSLPQEDDYDVLKEGRKQTEERMQKALLRVKSMAQYPEARAQYRRLLTSAEEFRENKDASEPIPDDAFYPDDDLIDIESLLDDDTFMSLTFQ